MKVLAREMKTFTAAELIAQMRADADYAALLDGGVPSAPNGNLKYWTEAGKITKSGEGLDAKYTVVNL